MRAPEFWRRPESALAALLAPVGGLYDAAGRLRAAFSHPVRLARPVLCVGNLTAGGAGKTPVALALAAWFQARGLEPHFLSRGYGGSKAGPLRVDPSKHGFREVGDEPLLLAERAPTWIARDRPAGAAAAIASGADLVVMDDGLQNPSLVKDLALLVVDGGYGFGNGRVMPAGPLRETIGHALERVAAAVVIGEDETGVASLLERHLPVLAARLAPTPAARALARMRVVAFAGIARPAKFFATLQELRCSVVRRYDFADHHAYTPDEIMTLVEEAAGLGAEPVTTEKDLVRIPLDARAMVRSVRVALEWDDEAALARLLRPLAGSRG